MHVVAVAVRGRRGKDILQQALGISWILRLRRRPQERNTVLHVLEAGALSQRRWHVAANSRAGEQGFGGADGVVERPVHATCPPRAPGGRQREARMKWR